MSWDDFYSSFKKTVGLAADKINQTADLATLQVKLSMAERRLDEAYAELGRNAYRHFTIEESGVDWIPKSMMLVDEAQKAVDLLEAQIAACKGDAKKKAHKAEPNTENAEEEPN